MSIELCVLASGSGGNASLVRTPAGAFLIDCGIGPKIAANRLHGTGVVPAQVAAVCLTHLDRDHFNPQWAGSIAYRKIRIYCAAERVDDLLGMTNCAALRPLVTPFDHQSFEPVPGVAVTASQVAHDQTGSHAFHVRSGATSLGYATDLGSVPTTLIDRFCGVDVLAIESNYDPEMQRNSGRPAFLQRRITGGRGHLSNDQALSAVRAIFERCHRAGKHPPRHVVLLHRSRQCNCPHLLRRTFAADVRLASCVVLSEQDRRTEWMSAEPRAAWLGEQMSLAFG